MPERLLRGADRQEHPVDKFPTQHLDPMRSIRLQSSNGANRRIAGAKDYGFGRVNSAGKRAYSVAGEVQGSARSGRFRGIPPEPREGQEAMGVYCVARRDTVHSESERHSPRGKVWCRR